ncbi:HTH-type transcriptional repressor CarH [Niveibacterium umoris]|uniref:DNA-binding transcriptional MerR regulator/methylmalonyl-CoA mutase cobalamin-binding subunit n=1 Tax=Niveibacterium umoris TaxID=1193620 RepID=A0A840BMD3_9RHOO|nr:MerR family transcriptional regulator [Niveibacterium umoris]MBB4012689.1 DNA-binding transcriptional MerR regulator/methylmalonyl-CoA mutase cobalamin-binding subunit [Niveibacterium umoris]
MSKPQQKLAIAAVERETGLPKDTLRMWERRYGFPQPERDANDERLYPAEQVDKLRLMKRLLDQGMRPGKLIGASIEELGQLLEARPAPEPDCAQTASRCNTLIEQLRLHRSEELRRALQQSLLKQGLQGFVTDTVAPMNQRVGSAWLRGEIDVPEEHLYTELMQNLLRSAISAHGGGSSPRILLTTFPDELHVLGLLMAEAMLVSEGATCVSLGTQMPIADIDSAARTGGFDVVALSFSAAYPARQAQDGLAELRHRLPGETSIWAGGRALADRPCAIDGVRIITDIRDTLAALEAWRMQHTN